MNEPSQGPPPPRTERGRATRDRIVDAAAHLMHLRGVHATSVDDVLEVAGVGKGQFYHYFEGRSALEEAVLERQVGRQPEVLRPDAVPDTWASVEAWFESIYAVHAMNDFRGGCPLGAMAAEVADRTEDLRRRLDDAFRLKAGHLARGLAALKENGGLTGDADPEALAEFVIAVAQGGLLLARTRKDGRPLRNALDHALEHLRGFRP